MCETIVNSSIQKGIYNPSSHIYVTSHHIACHLSCHLYKLICLLHAASRKIENSSILNCSVNALRSYNTHANPDTVLLFHVLYFIHQLNAKHRTRCIVLKAPCAVCVCVLFVASLRCVGSVIHVESFGWSFWCHIFQLFAQIWRPGWHIFSSFAIRKDFVVFTIFGVLG